MVARMADNPKIRRILCEHLHDPSSSFSVGSLGAIAEFHRKADESLVVDDPLQLISATARGALRIDLTDGVTPLAYETLSRRPGLWSQGVVFCLPARRGAGQGRTGVTELGPDRDAIRESDRDAILFDIGLAARNVDFCVRTRDTALIALLRKHLGRSILAPGSQAMAAMVEASPHRVVVSRLARIEVYQAIGKVATPDGPHTHVLPKFLRSGRTQSANIPVPARHLACLSLYPPNPLQDANGDAKPFDAHQHAHFQSLLTAWGAPLYCCEKRRVVRTVQEGLAPAGYAPHDSRLGRIALRVALRQLRAANPENTEKLERWLRCFDLGPQRLQAKDA